MNKAVLSGLPLDDLKEALKPLPSYRGQQVFHWLARGARSFADMTNLSLPLRAELDAKFSLYSSVISAQLPDPDGTVKLQITLHDGTCIEAVLLADREHRRTACLSTQVGCPMGCVFCKTGTLGLIRNLDSAEIVEQFFHLHLIEKTEKTDTNISNIVIMGMGEPLKNLPELRRALAVLTGPEGLGFSKRRITLSTSGIVEGIRDLTDKGPDIRLALSLTTADAGLRERLMPVTVTNPLDQVKEALRSYQQRRKRRITLEAVLLGGINTREADVDALATFAEGLEVVVNLIPWNPVPGMSFEGRPLREPSSGELAIFIKGLEKKGLIVTRRLRKGRSITGACGQLGGNLTTVKGVSSLLV
ncbi:MAG: 23S rRNA (adenine(2503)-C(2))-methyltransferase RlmN [Treponema sp.]|jgi:23S rRNA (adenine2503-C2)-methyltransferase|nr:23S rRNA (adenine(2503)-C(2))-methyltransferase RlmN [Treponema sp.]